MAANKEAMMRTFWLERTLLIGLLYFGVDKKHFLPMLACLILHDFIVFIAKDVVYSSFKAAQSLDLDRWKLRSYDPRDINLIKSGKNKVIEKNLKKVGYGDPELGTKKNHEHVGDEGNMHQVPCHKCKMVVEQEAMKAKEKYKEKYKKKLMEKEEKFKNDKSSLKDKYNEDREKWEDERNLLKKKYEEMRWT